MAVKVLSFVVALKATLDSQCAIDAALFKTFLPHDVSNGLVGGTESLDLGRIDQPALASELDAALTRISDFIQ